MTAIIDPDEALALFDELNQNSVTERRLACYALREYYGAVLTNIGTEYLNFRPDIRNDSPYSQWNNVKTRLETLNDFSVPDPFDGLIETVNSISNDVDHDFGNGPPGERVADAGALAREWRDWITTQAETYRDVEGELDARDTIIRITRSILESVHQPSGSREHGLSADQERINERAEDLLGDLALVETQTSTVTNQLIFLLTDAKELERTHQRIDETEAAVDQRIDNEFNRRREEAAFQRLMEQADED